MYQTAQPQETEFLPSSLLAPNGQIGNFSTLHEFGDTYTHAPKHTHKQTVPFILSYSGNQDEEDDGRRRRSVGTNPFAKFVLTIT